MRRFKRSSQWTTASDIRDLLEDRVPKGDQERLPSRTFPFRYPILVYHYHFMARNTKDFSGCPMSCAAETVSGIFGVAKDGFPIYGAMQYYSASEGKIYINPENCADCELRQLMEEHLDICGGLEVADGDAGVGTTYRYIASNTFPYHFQCFRGDVSLSQYRRAGEGWLTYAVTDSCGLNADQNGTCDTFNADFLAALGCTPGNCPFTASNLRAHDSLLSDIYYQCDGCSNDECITYDTTTPTTPSTTTTSTTSTGFVEDFSCGPRLQFSGFGTSDEDLNGLWTLAMTSQGTVETNDNYPYYKHTGSDLYLWWMWHGDVGHWVLNQTPGSHGGDRLKSAFGGFDCPQAKTEWEGASS